MFVIVYQKSQVLGIIDAKTGNFCKKLTKIFLNKLCCKTRKRVMAVLAVQSSEVDVVLNGKNS